MAAARPQPPPKHLQANGGKRAVAVQHRVGRVRVYRLAVQLLRVCIVLVCVAAETRGG